MSLPTVLPALYDVSIAHARRAPVSNAFRYGSFYWLVDADAPPQLPRPWRWVARFDHRDHLDVRALLAERGIRPQRLVMLANARVLGYVFNPISLWWAFDVDGRQVACVAEVHNTYGGRHAYVLGPDRHRTADVAKELYVSPFYPVDGHYDIRVSEPGETVAVSVTLRRSGDEPFVATLRGRRQPLTWRTLARLSWRYPWAPMRVSALIRRQGIALWARGLKVQPR